MQDIGFILNLDDGFHRQVFLSSGPALFTPNWQLWEKPRGCRWVSIIVIGSGGGGASGTNDIDGNARGGGAGGGSGGIGRLIVPAYLLPDTLFVRVSNGGAGGQPGVGSGPTVHNDGAAGVTSFVSLSPEVSQPGRILLRSENVAAQPGIWVAGPLSTGGAGATISSAVGSTFASLGISVWVAGAAGVNGGAIAGGAGVSTTPLTAITCGGAGGAGTQVADFAGGAISASGLFGQGVPGGAAGGFFGNPGYTNWAPLCGIAGSGGGSKHDGVGGNGGDGVGIGCGGGGGGGGTTAGAGGAGGPGIVIIGAL